MSVYSGLRPCMTDAEFRALQAERGEDYWQQCRRDLRRSRLSMARYWTSMARDSSSPLEWIERVLSAQRWRDSARALVVSPSR